MKSRSEGKGRTFESCRVRHFRAKLGTIARGQTPHGANTLKQAQPRAPNAESA